MKPAGFPVDHQHLKHEEEPEQKLIRRIVAGETDLYGALAERYHRRIFGLVQHVVGNRMEAEDIVQETHVRALTYLHQFGGQCRFVTWLSRVATNEAFNQLRCRRRWNELSDRLALALKVNGFPAAGSPDPEKCVLEKEAREVLKRAVAKLPARYRMVFLLRDVGDVAMSEVARRLKIKDENVRVRLHRVRRLMRKSISRQLPSPLRLRTAHD